MKSLKKRSSGRQQKKPPQDRQSESSQSGLDLEQAIKQAGDAAMQTVLRQHRQRSSDGTLAKTSKRKSKTKSSENELSHEDELAMQGIIDNAVQWGLGLRPIDLEMLDDMGY